MLCCVLMCKSLQYFKAHILFIGKKETHCRKGSLKPKPLTLNGTLAPNKSYIRHIDHSIPILYWCCHCPPCLGKKKKINNWRLQNTVFTDHTMTHKLKTCIKITFECYRLVLIFFSCKKKRVRWAFVFRCSTL